MVKDRNNYYFTRLLGFLQEEYTGIAGGTEYTSTPPSFPYMYYKQVGGSTALKTLSGTEDGITLAVEIKIYARKSADARMIANHAREFLAADFGIDEFHPVENVADTSIRQFLIRCSKHET